MESQITVRLPRDLDRALRTASRSMQRRNSEIVRMALRHFLEMPSNNQNRPAEGVRGLIGSLSSGVPDLAERHREYLLESIKNAR